MSTIEDCLSVLPAEATEKTEAVAKEVAPVKEESVDLFAKKFGALTKREKEIRNKETSLSKWGSLESKAAQLKENPDMAFEILQELGLDYDSMTEAILKKHTPTPQVSEIEQLKAEIQAMKDERNQEKTEIKTKAEAERSAEETKVYDTYKGQITSFLETNKEAFELVNTFADTETVFETIQAYYDETGKIVDIETACGWVEAHLENQAMNLTKANKIRNMITSPQDKQVQTQSKFREPTTLSTSQMAARQSPASKTETADPRDRDSRIKAILARMN